MIIFYGLLILLIVEQIFCFFTGSYPYRYGVPVRTIHIPGLKAFSHCSPIMRQRGNLRIIESRERKEVYIRYKYPFLTGGGPLFFLGQIRYDDPDKLRLRVGPVTAVFTLYYLIPLLLTGKPVAILLVFLIVAVLGTCFYRRLISAVLNVIREQESFRS